MTREEHIENLKAIASDMPSDKCSDWIESLMAGVKALEQEPCENCCNGNQIEKAKLCQKSYLAGMEHKQEPCEDVISRQAALDINEHYHGQMPNHVNHEIWKEINALPSVTVQPKMGQWKRINKEKYVQHAMSYYRCSECGEEIIGKHNYCPNCGRKMQEVEE